MDEYRIIQLKNFCNRWNKKIDITNTTDLACVFDNFISLEIIYNSIYNVVFDELNEKHKKDSLLDIWNKNNKLKLKKESNLSNDSKKSSFWVAYYLKDEIEGSLFDNISQEIFYFEKIVKEEVFKFDFKDSEEINRGFSGTKIEKMTSLLKTLYQIRCNLFHGEKSFEEVQKTLLIQAISCLYKLNCILLKKLEDESIV